MQTVSFVQHLQYPWYFYLFFKYSDKIQNFTLDEFWVKLIFFGLISKRLSPASPPGPARGPALREGLKLGPGPSLTFKAWARPRLDFLGPDPSLSPWIYLNNLTWKKNWSCTSGSWHCPSDQLLIKPLLLIHQVVFSQIFCVRGKLLAKL